MKSIQDLILEAKNVNFDLTKLAELFNDGENYDNFISKHESIKIHQDLLKSIKNFDEKINKNDCLLIISKQHSTSLVNGLKYQQIPPNGWMCAILFPNGSKYAAYSVYSVFNQPVFLSFQQQKNPINDILGHIIFQKSIIKHFYMMEMKQNLFVKLFQLKKQINLKT